MIHNDDEYRAAVKKLVDALCKRDGVGVVADPMAPDYDALATEEPTSQVEDCRDSAEVPGAQ